LSFVGYFARRAAGPGRGYLVTGLIGGLASSTSVTFTFARTSHSDETASRALGYGAIGGQRDALSARAARHGGAESVAAAHRRAVSGSPALLAFAITWFGAKQSPADDIDERPVTNPLQLPAALQMAAIFQVVLMLCGSPVVTVGTAGSSAWPLCSA
jgi:uncharacterized membrane protein (DUF4010 family)